MGKPALGLADLLQNTGCQHGPGGHVEELVFDGGAAGVDHQNFHNFSLFWQKVSGFGPSPRRSGYGRAGGCQFRCQPRRWLKSLSALEGGQSNLKRNFVFG
jgi:hypothetical protein